MKKSKTMRIASLLLVLVLVTTCFVGTTFTKYTSSANGTATATVAKWSIEVNDEQIAVTNGPKTVSFDLFSTIKDSNGTDDETDVVSGKIAPGTSGAFNLKVENLSEVTANYAITFEVTNGSNVPLQYSADGTTWKSDISEIYSDLSGNLDKINGETVDSETEIVYWKWEFNGDDTALGIAAQNSAPTVTVAATITATQVD